MRSLYSKRSSVSHNTHGQHQEVLPTVIADLEKTINPFSHLPGMNKCQCQLCLSPHFLNQPTDGNLFRSNSREASKYFKKLLDGLTLSGAKSLKLFLPDIFFVDGQSVQIYQTSRKDGRVVKLSGLTPLRLIYPTFVRMRKQYKSLLEQNYNQKMLDKINPQFMHIKYYDKLVPSHFHGGTDSASLESNKHQFRKYVLHNNKKYQIQQIEEHKMNQKQPFCLIKFNDGNCQLLNQTEFEAFSLGSIAKMQQACFFQSYIKYKLEEESISYSQYTFSATAINQQLDQRAEKEIMVLLGAINKYDQGYKDIQTLEEFTVDIMQSSPKEYAELMTYKIVHFLAMASRIYVNHIKIKWIANDIGTVYFQQIMEMETTDLPHRIIKFRLPIRDDSPDFYNSNNFVQIYKDMKKRKAINTLIIKRDLDCRTYEEILDIMDPSSKKDEVSENKASVSFTHRGKLPFLYKKNRAGSQTSRTIDDTYKPSISPPNIQTIEVKKSRYHNFSTYEEHLKQHPEIVMKNRPYDSSSLGRYSQAPKKIEKVDKKINNHFIFNMSSQDYKTFGNQAERRPKAQSIQLKSDLNEYLQKKNAKVYQSVLYNTFHQLNSEKAKQVSLTLNHQKMQKKYRLQQ